MQDPAAAARRFLEHLTVERGLSDHTLDAYRRDLERYLAFLRARHVDDLAAIDARTVRAFVASVSAGDVRARRRAVQGDDRGAAVLVRPVVPPVRGARRARDDDPTAGVVRPRLPRLLPHPLTVEEAVAIVEAPAPSSGGRAARSCDPRAAVRCGPACVRADGARRRRRRPGGGIGARASERGARSASCRSAAMRARRVGAYLRRARPALATTRSRGALFLNTRGGRLTRQSCARLRRGARAPRRHPTDRLAARPAALLRDAPARGWRRRPGRAGAARAMRASRRRRSTRW